MFGSKRQKKGVVLVVDIDDASVGVALVRTDEKAVILRAERATLPFENRDTAHSVSAVTQLLEATVKKVVDAYAADPTAHTIIKTFAIIRSPWTRFRTAQAEEVHEHAITVTEAEVQALAKKALESPSDFSPGNRLENGIVHVYVNGYPTNAPAGKQGARLAVTAYESDIKPEIRTAVSEALLRVLPGRVPTLRSSMCALLSVTGEHMPEAHRCVILDVGSSSTHCAVVLKEAVTQSIVIPIGLSTVLTRIAAGALPEETLTQLRMLAHDTCTTDVCKALKDSLARIEPELAKSFGEGFATIAAKRRLPNATFLSAPAEIMPWISGFFLRVDFAQFTATTQPLAVEPFTPERLADAVEWEGTVPDISLGIDAAFVNILAKGM